MYGLGVGMLSKTDSGTPKFLAKISLGVWASQSSILNVVLQSSQWKCVSHTCTWICVPNFVEIALIKDEEELVPIFKTLYGMGDTLGEVPDVTIVQLFSLIFPVFVDCRDKDAAFVYKSPFSLKYSL